MAHPKDDEVYPVDCVVRWKRTGQFALIKGHTFLRDGKGFLNYLGEIEGRKGMFALYHDDIEIECLPTTWSQ
jgi:hypothetical protein